MKERWKQIAGGDYELSNFGQLRRLKPARGTRVGRLSKGRPLGPYGYIGVTLGKGPDGRVRTAYLHVLVAETFIGSKPAGTEVNHCDGDKNNNRADNLEYLTHAKNQKHASENGLLARGEHVGTSVLTRTQVHAIRKLYPSSTCKALGLKYGVCAQTIHNIISGRAWWGL